MMTEAQREEIDNIRRAADRGLQLANDAAYESDNDEVKDAHAMHIDLYQHILNLASPLIREEP